VRDFRGDLPGARILGWSRSVVGSRGPERRQSAVTAGSEADSAKPRGSRRASSTGCLCDSKAKPASGGFRSAPTTMACSADRLLRWRHRASISRVSWIATGPTSSKRWRDRARLVFPGSSRGAPTGAPLEINAEQESGAAGADVSFPSPTGLLPSTESAHPARGRAERLGGGLEVYAPQEPRAQIGTRVGLHRARGALDSAISAITAAVMDELGMPVPGWPVLSESGHAPRPFRLQITAPPHGKR
jgi:hypothetical protein